MTTQAGHHEGEVLFSRDTVLAAIPRDLFGNPATKRCAELIGLLHNTGLDTVTLSLIAAEAHNIHDALGRRQEYIERLRNTDPVPCGHGGDGT